VVIYRDFIYRRYDQSDCEWRCQKGDQSTTFYREWWWTISGATDIAPAAECAQVCTVSSRPKTSLDCVWHLQRSCVTLFGPTSNSTDLCSCTCRAQLVSLAMHTDWTTQPDLLKIVEDVVRERLEAPRLMPGLFSDAPEKVVGLFTRQNDHDPPIHLSDLS